MHKLITLGLLFIPTLAYANMVWPALYLETRLFSWWAITIGLVIEYLFVRKLFQAPVVKSIYATFLANLVSALVGVLLIPILGIVWEIFPGFIFHFVFDVGTFNPATWVGTFFLACFANVVLESFVYKKVFATPFKFRSKFFLWFMLANAASVGVAMASLFIYPINF